MVITTALNKLVFHCLKGEKKREFSFLKSKKIHFNISDLRIYISLIMRKDHFIPKIKCL